MKRVGKLIFGVIAILLGAALIVGGVSRIINGDWAGVIWLVGGIGIIIAATVLVTNGKLRDFFEIVNDVLK